MSGLMNDIEHQVYLRWFDWIEANAKKPDVLNFLYLKCTPETSHRRVNIRGREEETGISLDYLREIHERHEEWLSVEKNVTVLDAELDYAAHGIFKHFMDGFLHLRTFKMPIFRPYNF
jgi:deoxyadenosine/deoxycytidine kinase